MPRRNLLSLFDALSRFQGETAVVERRGYRREVLTYGGLRSLALGWSDTIATHGIGPGDRVLLWGSNSANWVACFWAILLRGAVVVPMDAAASPDFVGRVVTEAQVKLILQDAALPALSHGPAVLRFTELAVAASPAGQPSPGDANPGYRSTRSTVAQILFTSGTTSEPRGVVLTHGNFLANVEPLEQGIEPYRRYERWTHPVRFVCTVPLSHVFGQFMTLFVPLLVGATVVFENSPHPSEVLRTIKRERATALVAVPRLLDALRTALQQEIEARRWGNWFRAAYFACASKTFLRRVWSFRRLHGLLGWKFWAFISGGAALSSETEAFFKRIGYAVVQGYGMTETASLISLNHPFKAAQGSVGKILPGRDFRLAADGEILVRGESVSSAYWQGGEFRPATQEEGGWLRTGDLGELDAEGNLRFRGRKKNIIVTPAGLNIYPEDLEAALREQPKVREAVVMPLALDGNAEACAALLTAHAGASAESEAQAAVDAANSSLAEYQRIRRWIIWPDADFPRTPTGKPRLGLIASRAAALLRGPGSAVIPSEATDILSSFREDRSLKDLSSLDRVELLSTLEHRYNVELNETEFAGAQSFAEIRQLLTQPSARRSNYVYPNWTQRIPVRLFRLLVYYLLIWPATLLLAHPRIRGREHLAGLEGPALFVCNHTTRRADIGLILFALPARVRHRLAVAMGGETLQTFRHPPREWFFGKRWAWQLGYFLVVALFNVFPLPQLSGFRESFRFAGESVDRGYSILVFPEGVVNDRDSPGMVPFQPGIGLLAENLNLPVVPMRLDGVWQMKQEHRRLARLGELTVHIGVPVTFPPDTPPAEIANRLQEFVRVL